MSQVMLGEASAEDPRVSSIPSLIEASPPNTTIAVVNSQQESYRQWAMAMMKKSFELQKMLIQGAEDVGSIHEMMFLKEEVVGYIYQDLSQPIQMVRPLIDFPSFYGISLFWIVLRAKRHGRRPTYAYHLADIIKARLTDIFPGYSRLFTGPTFMDVEASLMKFGDNNRLRNPNLVEQAGSLFEKVLGETYHFINTHYQRYGKVPRTLFFFFYTCLFFRKLEFKNPDGEFFDEPIVARLQRNLSHISPQFFSDMQRQLNTAIQHMNR